MLFVEGKGGGGGVVRRIKLTSTVRHGESSIRGVRTNGEMVRGVSLDVMCLLVHITLYGVSVNGYLCAYLISFVPRIPRSESRW